MPGGRPRGTGTPTNLKLLKGVANARINDDEPIPQDGIPTCPSKNKEVREVWDYTVAQLKVMRTITMADRDTLAAYCQAVITYRKAQAVMDTEGPLIDVGKTSCRKHPANDVIKQASADIATYARAFGLNPAARSVIKVGDQRPKQSEAGASRLLSG